MLLADCTANDGAIIDTVWLIQRSDNNVVQVNLYISTSAHGIGVTATGAAANASFLLRFGFAAGAHIGETIEAKLPKLLAPVPHAGVNGPDGLPPQFRGLYLQKGQALWAAVESSTLQLGAPNIACQGGYF